MPGEMAVARKTRRMSDLGYGKVGCEQQRPRPFYTACNKIAMWRQACGLTKGQSEMMRTKASNGC